MLSARGIVAGYHRRNPVLDGVDLQVAPGETVGLAGPSGCGKSTLAKVLCLLLEPYGGQLWVDGERVRSFRHVAPVRLRTKVGVVFQQPRLAVDPRFTLRDVVAEPLRACPRLAADRNGTNRPPAPAEPAGPDGLAELVGLTPELLDRRPHEVSDGQLQRACLARALALRPSYLVCDEMTAMADASSTAALVRVVREYAHRTDAGVLAISHDEPLLCVWADRVQHLS